MAQINPAVYPTKYKISCADRDGSNVVEFSDDIAKLLIDGKLTFETYMDGSNSYCGFEPGKYDYWVGGALFSVTNGDPNDPRSGNWVNYTTSAKKINFRWFLKVHNNGSAPQGNMIQRWTPQKPPLETIGTVYNINQTARYDSLMTGREVICYYGAAYSTFYHLFPITNINIDRIQISPIFNVIKVIPTYRDGVITRYTTTSNNYRWEDIKPEDKTPAGDKYNENLWTKGWYDEIDETTGNISARYILVNCSVEARYGTFKFNQLTAGAMNGIFGESLNLSRWNADGDKVLPSDINTPVGYLVPMAEVPFSVKNEEGVLFQTLSGIDFPGSGSTIRGNNNPSSTIQYTYSDSAYGQSHYSAVLNEGNTITHSTINRGGGFLLNWSLGDLDGSFTLVTNGIGTDILDKIYASTVGVTQYYFNADGSVSRNNVVNSSTATIALDLTPFSLESLWATLASLGVWVITDINSLSSDFELGVDFPTNVYRGEVLPDGTTTGRMFQGEDAEQQPWDTIDYTPVIPTPTPPPGDDSGGDDIRPSDWTNLRIGAANNFVTLYGMTSETVSDFGRKMWAQLADPEFWQMVGTAFTNDFSINPADMMRYFVSLRYFPFDVSDFAHTTSSGVYIGRAASPIAPSVGVAYPIRLSNSVVQVSGGSLTISRYYNDYRDYDPCTTVQIHVPFCGSVEIPASEVMGHTLDLTYKIDLQTGAMLAVLCVLSNTYYVIATLAGTVGASIPITANNNIEFLQRIATIGGGLIGGGVSGALKGAMLGGEVGAVVGAVAGTVGGGVGALAGLPPVTVHKQGNASGFANLGGVPYAYATIQHCRFELPDNYGHTTGYACDFAATVKELSGYTVCDNVDTSGLSCNAHERDEIKRLLESGVYI